MHLFYRNVNEAFTDLVLGIHRGRFPTVRTTSRVGEVLQIPEPVTITYAKPLERVLFNETRDCNPFMHLFEALWMLAGRNDVAPIAYFNSQISNIASDDGKTFNGAYGYRWRKSSVFEQGMCWDDSDRKSVDQLPIIIDQLKRKPDSRRVVLQMWNVEDDLLRIDSTKDVCCNTCVYFLIVDGKLDMTVSNRSNDLVWGSLGANIVHFAFLQEYIAGNLKIPVGNYNQFSNNLHVYTERFKPDEWLADTTPDYYVTERIKPYPLISDPAEFESELPRFVDRLGPDKVGLEADEFSSPFLRYVATPALLAFRQHKARDYNAATDHCAAIEADDWRRACTTWIRKRQAAYLRAKDDGVKHES